MSLKEIINSFREELKEMSNLREESLSASRKIIFLSKQAIMAMHRGMNSEAKVKLEVAEELLKNIDDERFRRHDLKSGSLRTAYQEYAEARIFLNLLEEDKFPTYPAIDVPISTYLLGLGDVVGEFRRRSLDSLRKMELKKAEKCLSIMDTIYKELVALEEAYSVVPELRRKCDIARRLIEITMSEIASEARRASLESSIRLLARRIGLGDDEAINRAKA